MNFTGYPNTVNKTRFVLKTINLKVYLHLNYKL